MSPPSEFFEAQEILAEAFADTCKACTFSKGLDFCSEVYELGIDHVYDIYFVPSYGHDGTLPMPTRAFVAEFVVSSC